MGNEILYHPPTATPQSERGHFQEQSFGTLLPLWPTRLINPLLEQTAEYPFLVQSRRLPD